MLFDYEALPGSGPTGGEVPPSGLSTEAWRAITRYIEQDLVGVQGTAESGTDELVHEDAKLLASDGAYLDYFGYSVTVSGDR